MQLQAAGRKESRAFRSGGACRHLRGVASALLHKCSIPTGVEIDHFRRLRDDAFKLGPPALLLIGYAIQVLAKGLIVARNPDGLSDGPRGQNEGISLGLDEPGIRLP